MSKQEFKNIIDINANEADYYTLAVALHKTHKKKKLKLQGTFLEAIYRDTNRYMVIMKSTQCGISEYLIVRAIARTRQGKNIFYVLPTFDLKNQFVKERIDKSIAFTQYYRSLINKGDRKFTESTSLKMLLNGTMAYVGSNTEVAFVSFPADDAIIDELDQCNQDNLTMVPDRQAASEDKYTVKVANPTLNNFGIHEEYTNSDQKKWNTKCSNCGKYIYQDFFEHVVRQIDDNVYIYRDKDFDPLGDKDILPICNHCNKPYNRKASGEWVKTQEHRHSGYQISKMFSTAVELRELTDKLQKGLVNDIEMQRLYNSDLGLPYVAKGSKVDELMLDSCIVPDFIIPRKNEYRCVMGIDVGSVFNVVIREILPDGRLRLVFADEIYSDDGKELYELYKNYEVVCAIIDGLPETRLSKKFSREFSGAFICYYGTEKKDSVNAKDKIVTVNRTQTLDAVKEYFLTQTFLLPTNAKDIKNYYEQLTASTRVLNEKNKKYEWQEGSKADHYMHAEGYCLTAKRILSMIGV